MYQESYQTISKLVYTGACTSSSLGVTPSSGTGTLLWFTLGSPDQAPRDPPTAVCLGIIELVGGFLFRLWRETYEETTAHIPLEQQSLRTRRVGFQLPLLRTRETDRQSRFSSHHASSMWVSCSSDQFGARGGKTPRTSRRSCISCVNRLTYTAVLLLYVR